MIVTRLKNTTLQTLRKWKMPFLMVIIATSLSCQEVLQPKPVDLLLDELVLKRPSDVEAVRTGLYGSFRGLGAMGIVAGDLTADMGQFNGTFSVFSELCNHQITPANSAVGGYWGAIYSVVYIANFIDENLENVSGVSNNTKKQLFAEAAFLRAYAYFAGLNTYGAIPNVTTTDIETNSNIGRANVDDIKKVIVDGYTRALNDLPEVWDSENNTLNKAFTTKNAARAALARYYLYEKDWPNAEKYASEVIASPRYALDTSFQRVISTEFDSECILELSYANTSSDDPGTATFGLNNMFVGRREVIPSNSTVIQLLSNASGTRWNTIRFDPSEQQGTDNGWSVRKYGSSDESNNNITLFRLAEQYLIRAEARAQRNLFSGANSASSDINMLRKRAKAPEITYSSRDNALLGIEQERLYELAYEGHRWYDLKRTGRIASVMAPVPNWNAKYELWPIPQAEIQRNPALKGNPNPGY
jgi:hypothetical protein